VDRDGAHTHAFRGPDHPAGDLASVGHQYGLEHRHASSSRITAEAATPRETNAVGLVIVTAALSCAAGLVIRFATRGRLTTAPRHRFRSSWLVVAALVVQLVGALVSSGSGYAVALMASALLAGTFVVRNIGIPGLALVGAGLTANALVVLLNGAMPVSLRAAESAGLDELALNLAADPRHELLTDATVLPWLGDVVPVPLPLRPDVVSVGDLLVAIGVALLLIRWLVAGPEPGTRARRRRPIEQPVGYRNGSIG
jgi:hypothetical protein